MLATLETSGVGKGDRSMKKPGSLSSGYISDPDISQIPPFGPQSQSIFIELPLTADKLRRQFATFQEGTLTSRDNHAISIDR